MVGFDELPYEIRFIIYENSIDSLDEWDKLRLVSRSWNSFLLDDRFARILCHRYHLHGFSDDVFSSYIRFKQNDRITKGADWFRWITSLKYLAPKRYRKLYAKVTKLCHDIIDTFDEIDIDMKSMITETNDDFLLKLKMLETVTRSYLTGNPTVDEKLLEYILFFALFPLHNRHVNGFFGEGEMYGEMGSFLVYHPEFHVIRHYKNYTLLQFAGNFPYFGRNYAIVLQSTENPDFLFHVVEVSSVLLYCRTDFISFMYNHLLDIRNGRLPVLNKTIQIFPCKGPGTSIAITKVCPEVSFTVHASCIAAMAVENGLFFNYRIRIAIHCPLNSPYSYQLSHRHWNIEYEQGITEEVHAESVVGYFPVFSSSQTSFTYQSSCSTKPLTPCGSRFLRPLSMGGYYVLVPGTINDPQGESFRISVGVWNFEEPSDYLITEANCNS